MSTRFDLKTAAHIVTSDFTGRDIGTVTYNRGSDAFSATTPRGIHIAASFDHQVCIARLVERHVERLLISQIESMNREQVHSLIESPFFRLLGERKQTAAWRQAQRRW